VEGKDLVFMLQGGHGCRGHLSLWRTPASSRAVGQRTALTLLLPAARFSAEVIA